MSKEIYNQIIDEVYTNYINKCREELDRFREQNPDVLVDYREDTKELFIRSIKDDKHWFSGEKNFSKKWGLEIGGRELSREERYNLMSSITGHTEKNIETRKKINNFGGNTPGISYHEEWLDSFKIPTKLITLTYNNETIEFYE